MVAKQKRRTDGHCVYRKVAFLYFFLFLFTVPVVFSQDQHLADSLEAVYRENKFTDTARLQLLQKIAYNEIEDFRKGLRYAEELIRLSEKEGNKKYLRIGYFLAGTKKRELGDFSGAVEAYFRSAAIAIETKNRKGEAQAYGGIADAYSSAENHPNALEFYQKAIVALRQLSDSVSLSSFIFNLGDEYLKTGNLDSALVYFKEAKKFFEGLDNPGLLAYSLGNIGTIYARIGRNTLAEKNIDSAIHILEKMRNYPPICEYLLSMADVYLNKSNKEAALNYAARSVKLAEQFGLKEQSAVSCLKLSRLYESVGNTGEALAYFKKHVAYRDAINNLDNVRKMANLRTDFELSQKQQEVDRANKEKLTLLAILCLAVLLLGTSLWFYKTISKEKHKSESLLLNILPLAAAGELKQNGRVDAVKFEQVTVLFTDFVGFSKLAEHIEPELLVKSIDFYFRRFDAITTKYGLEKIKTVGDSYMCAGGLPTPNPYHARQVVAAAREMMALVSSKLEEKDGLCHFDIRIGIHTGPVVAGVVGTKKWQYDIWGDTVNVASRMESMSKPGRINLSETTWQHVKDEFSCEYRGEFEVKNRGLLKMYFLAQTPAEEKRLDREKKFTA